MAGLVGLATLHGGLAEVNSERTAKGGDRCGDFTGVTLCAFEVRENSTGVRALASWAWQLFTGVSPKSTLSTAKGDDHRGDFTGARFCAP